MLNVLVVDDDHLVRTGFITIMPWEKHGLQVVGDVGNGDKALAFLREHPVDLLITDLAMPFMSGIELMKQAKRLQPRLKMVVLTFHHEFEFAQEAIRLGALDYITKVELEEDRLDEVLRRIAGRISEDEPVVAADEGTLSEESDLMDKWRSFDWAADDMRFARQLEELARKKLSLAQLRSLFETASSGWAEMLPELRDGLEPTIGLQTWSQWKEWLENARLRIREVEGTQAYSPDIAACIRRAQDYIIEHLEEELPMPQIARMVGMSRSYFSRCFHDITGQTFHEHVRDLRIERAKTLLRTTDKSVGWIAAQSGYPNGKYFCKVFRSATGMLPSAYRKR